VKTPLSKYNEIIADKIYKKNQKNIFFFLKKRTLFIIYVRNIGCNNNTDERKHICKLLVGDNKQF
jgi:hypothetical protein